MHRWATAAAIVLLASAMSGCSAAPRDPGAVPLASGKGGILVYVVDTGDAHQDRLPGVQVIVTPGGGAEMTDENGGASFRDLPPGSYNVFASEPGYEAGPVTVEVLAGSYAEAVVFMEKTTT